MENISRRHLKKKHTQKKKKKKKKKTTKNTHTHQVNKSFGHILTVLDQPTVHFLHFTMSVIETALITLIKSINVTLGNKEHTGMEKQD